MKIGWKELVAIAGVFLFLGVSLGSVLRSSREMTYTIQTQYPVESREIQTDLEPISENSADFYDTSTEKVAINQATLEELESLPMIGKVRAQAILDYLAKHGPIREVGDLKQVEGIGEELANILTDYITFD